MRHRFDTRGLSRRDLFKAGFAVAGGAALTSLLPASVFAGQAGAALDPIDQMRAQMGQAPIEQMKLADNLTLLMGPGGNVVVLNGADGKIVVDGFVQTVWPKLKQVIDGLGTAPIKTLIDTHWHFDHADNNANFRKAGASILAHENTKKRLSETHDLLGMHFLPAPAAALPTQTFKSTQMLSANGEMLHLGYIQPAHTDTDIYIHYTKSNVLHMGDTFFNGMYPVIDPGTGGNIGGMIAAADLGLKMADARTKIVPGHGPLGDKAALTKYRDVLVTVRDRVKKLKAEGKTVDEVVASKPSSEFDAAWGVGFMMPKDFLSLVYATL